MSIHILKKKGHTIKNVDECSENIEIVPTTSNLSPVKANEKKTDEKNERRKKPK